MLLLHVNKFLLRNENHCCKLAIKKDDGEIINEQFIGTSFTDTEWVKDTNWERMATESDITFKHNIHITEKDMYLGQLSKVDGSFSESTAYFGIGFYKYNRIIH